MAGVGREAMSLGPGGFPLYCCSFGYMKPQLTPAPHHRSSRHAWQLREGLTQTWQPLATLISAFLCSLTLLPLASLGLVQTLSQDLAASTQPRHGPLPSPLRCFKINAPQRAFRNTLLPSFLRWEEGKQMFTSVREAFCILTPVGFTKVLVRRGPPIFWVFQCLSPFASVRDWGSPMGEEKGWTGGVDAVRWGGRTYWILSLLLLLLWP